MRVIALDNSTLVAEARCNLQSWLRYGLDLTTKRPKHAADAGTAFHLAAEAAFKGFSQLAISKAMTFYQARDLTGAKDRLSATNVERICAAWLKRYPVERNFLYTRDSAGGMRAMFKIDPLLVEVPFQLPLAEIACPNCDAQGCEFCMGKGGLAIHFTGRIDAIVEMDGKRWALDHKTTGKWDAHWLAQFKESSQVSGYTWAVGEYLMSGAAQGCIINAVSMAKLNSSPTRCPKHKMPYVDCAEAPEHFRTQFILCERTEEQLAAWKQAALHLASRFVKRLACFPTLGGGLGVIPATGPFTDACDWCDFNTFCAGGCTGQAQLVEDRWDPLKARS